MENKKNKKKLTSRRSSMPVKEIGFHFLEDAFKYFQMEHYIARFYFKSLF